MRVVPVAKLRVHLGECIEFVKPGGEILVTQRGKPVAMVSPVSGTLSGDAGRAELVRRGIIRPGKGPVSMEFIDSLPAIDLSQDDILRVMDDEREDRA